MESKRTQSLFTQAGAVLAELFGEFAYLENIIHDQGAELKQLRFEASGRMDLRQQHVIDWDEAHQMELFPAVPVHSTDLRCEDMIDYMIDYEEPDPALAELLLEGTINSKPLPGEIIAAANEVTFDVTTWRWVATVDVAIGDRA